MLSIPTPDDGTKPPCVGHARPEDTCSKYTPDTSTERPDGTLTNSRGGKYFLVGLPSYMQSTRGSFTLSAYLQSTSSLSNIRRSCTSGIKLIKGLSKDTNPK